MFEQEHRDLDEIINRLQEQKTINLLQMQRLKKRKLLLKDKIAKGAPTSDILFNLDNTLKDEALSALIALGFGKKSAEQKINQVLKNTPEINNVEDLVKAALS